MNNDQEYLSRPLIEDVTYIITADCLRISSPCTLYAGARPYIPLKKDALLELYTKVLCIAKQRGAKVSYRSHLRKNIIGNWDEYEKDCHEVQRLYAEMLGKAKEIAIRGLHYGTVDDEFLKGLQSLEAKYHALFHGNRSISIISEIQSRLESALGCFTNSEGCNITIYL